jgi:hypothetical protein
MRGMLAALSPHEENTFRRIQFGTEGDLDPAHVRRLLQLELVEWTGATWRLTEMGRQRLDTLGANPSD